MKVIQGSYAKTMEYCNDILNGDFFEFEFPFVNMDSRFCEIDRFLYESRHTLRFKNKYEGNVVINVSQWNDKNEVNGYFESFMYFLKDNSNDYKCTIIMDKPCCEKLLELFKNLFDIELIQVDLSKVKTKNKIGFSVDTLKEEDHNV